MSPVISPFSQSNFMAGENIALPDLINVYFVHRPNSTPIRWTAAYDAGIETALTEPARCLRLSKRDPEHETGIATYIRTLV